MKSTLKKIVVAIMTWQAVYILRKYNPKIVAITGSVGKTTAKEAVYSVLADSYRTRKSEKSYNSEFGVPLTIIGRESGWNSFSLWLKNILYGFRVMFFPIEYPEWLVLEVGADKPGDIEALTVWLKPDIAVVTKLAKVPVHVEFFTSPQAVWKEKSFLARAVRPGGYLILNADDENIMAFRALTQEKIITYGLEAANADVSATHITTNYSAGGTFPIGMSLRINSSGNSVPLAIHDALGIQHVYPVAAAAAVAKCVGINPLRAVHALEAHETPPGRMKLIQGIKGTLIIDDSYNSSPIALKEALSTLESLTCKGKKIAILADMLELGTYSSDEHRKAGAYAAKIVDYLITVGPRARLIAEGALDNEMDEKCIFQFEDAQKAGKFVENRIKVGDMVLIKGSQGMRMEKAVQEIMAEPQKRATLLVRQTGGWKKK